MDKLAKVRAEIERRKKLHEKSLINPIHEGFELQNVIKAKIRELTYLLSFIDSMQKEPKECMFSKDNYTDEDRKVLCEDCKEKCAYAIADVISTNAQVKKEPVSDVLEGEINRYLSTWSTSKDNGIVFCEKMARHFCAWQKQQMMAKAVDATVHIDAGGYPYIPQVELYDYEKDIPFAKEGDKYKVILIKED